MKHSLYIMLAVCLLTSCGIYKKYERPSDISTENLYGSLQSTDTVSLGNLSWRQFFTDPQLQALIEEALQNNTMKQAEIRIKQAEVPMKLARIAWLPTIAFTPNGKLASFDNSTPSKTWTAPLSLDWDLGSYGSITNIRRKAEVQRKISRLTKQVTQAGVISSVANMYYTLCMLDEQCRIAAETAENWRKMVDMQQKLFDAGQCNEIALAQYRANYIEIKVQVEELETTRRTLQNSLCTLLSRTPGHISRTSIFNWKAPEVIETGVPLQLLSRRPDVRIAEENLAIAYYDKNIARSNFFPNLTLSGVLGWTNQSGNTVNPGKMMWNAASSLMQPIFARGAIVGQYKIAKAELEAKQLAFQQTLIEAGSEVNSNLTELQSANSKAVLYAEQVVALERACRATETLMNNSSNINYLQVLTARSSLLGAQLSQMANRYETIQRTIALYQSLGGGID